MFHPGHTSPPATFFECHPGPPGVYLTQGEPFFVPEHALPYTDYFSQSSTESSTTVEEEPRPLTLEELRKLAKAEKRKRRRATLKYRTLHASRERIRVESFNKAFAELRSLLPTTPSDKKLSKIEILRVSIAYIRYLQDLIMLN